ncbi:MAG: hypothetical protein IJA16_00715 [Clostridia bacterium]|nr:hypothetical protein [Clostridia bacterium]
MQNIQLGPFDDVSADYNSKQLLFLVTHHILVPDMACMGVMCNYISGKILGKQQYGT